MKEVKGIDITIPFPRMTYDEAMGRYGSDKPDTRFDMELVDVSEICERSGFKVFAGAVEKGGQVKAINVKGAADNYSRKDIDALERICCSLWCKGLAWLKVEEEGLKDQLRNSLQKKSQTHLNAALEAEEGDLLLFVADKKKCCSRCS